MAKATRAKLLFYLLRTVELQMELKSEVAALRDHVDEVVRRLNDRLHKLEGE